MSNEVEIETELYYVEIEVEESEETILADNTIVEISYSLDDYEFIDEYAAAVEIDVIHDEPTVDIVNESIIYYGTDPGSASQVTIVRRTAQILSGHRVVTPRTPDGKLVYADPNTLNDVQRQLWLTTGAWAADVDATVVSYGLVEESSWNWIVGRQVYLNDVGTLTQIVPVSSNSAFLAVIGTAVSPTELFFDPKLTVSFQI